MEEKISFQPLQKRLLYEDVIDQIKKSIISGKLRPGDHLPSERKLAEMFNVGRPTIREAIRSLGLMGLIEVNSGSKGSTIQDCSINLYMNTIREQMSWLVKIDQKTNQELWEVRYYVELGIAHSFARNATHEDFAKLDEIVGKMEASLNDMESYLQHSVEFHEYLAVGAKNKIFYLAWSGFKDLEYRNFVSTMKAFSPHGLTELFEANKTLLRAIKSKDSGAIDTAMKIHADTDKEFTFWKGEVQD